MIFPEDAAGVLCGLACFTQGQYDAVWRSHSVKGVKPLTTADTTAELGCE